MSGTMTRRKALLAAAIAAPVAIASACRAPTQIEVVVTTDLPCDASFHGAAITVGRIGAIEDQPATSTKASCTSAGKIGTIVVTPSGAADDLVAFKVVVGVGHGPESCTAKDGYRGGCIVARRALHYLPHEDLRVNVGLDGSCKDIPCASNETCVDGACHPATIDDPSRCASADGCGDEVLDGGAPDATSGDASDAGDGGTSDADATFEAGAPAPTVLTTGDGVSCALVSGGVKCWGDDVIGQRGDNAANGGVADPTPRDVLIDTSTKLSGVTSIAGGRDTTCALTGSGVRCWGFAQEQPDPDGGPPQTYGVATTLPALAGAREVAFGYQFMCWRVGTTTARCVGRDGNGELGNGTPIGWASPAVTAQFAPPVLQLTGGEYFSCALGGNGAVACVGDNSSNAADPFGMGTAVPTPHVIAPLPPMAEVRAGNGFSVCGRLASDGSIQCWGDDQWGQVGYPSDAARASGPQAILRGPGMPLVGTKRLASGVDFACAIASDDRVVCWGRNDMAQLGRGAPSHESSTASEVVGVSNAVAISAGVDHACAIDTQARVFCWGHNDKGQCGQPMATSVVTSATRVMGL